jgi:hypothetical protein
MKNPGLSRDFFIRCHPWRLPANEQSHWRSSGHCQTVGIALSGFALSGHRRFAPMLKKRQDSRFSQL